MTNAEIITILQKFFERNKRMPTVREVRDQILRTSSMRVTKEFIDSLIDEGLIRKDAKGKLQPTSEMMGLRKLGTVEAGYPSPAEEELADVMTLDEWLIKDRQVTYMLGITNDSMVDAGINNGDVVIVERFRKPRVGDIVVAEIDNKWTIKFYKKKGKIIYLDPANKEWPRIYPDDELRIEAVVVAMIRKYKSL